MAHDSFLVRSSYMINDSLYPFNNIKIFAFITGLISAYPSWGIDYYLIDTFINFLYLALIK
jgi:hypothetical protein